MARLKRILLSACFETAQRQRRCSRNKMHKILKDHKCLVIKQGMVKHNYCLDCANLVLQKAKEDLNCLTDELTATDFSTINVEE